MKSICDDRKTYNFKPFAIKLTINVKLLVSHLTTNILSHLIIIVPLEEILFAIKTK